MPRHKLTPDDRRRGQAKGAETKRARREEADEQARARLSDAAGEAVETLVAELKAEGAADRIRAAAQILDRAWGRPRQAIEADLRIEQEPVREIDPRPVLRGLVERGLLRPPENGAGA